LPTLSTKLIGYLLQAISSIAIIFAALWFPPAKLQVNEKPKKKYLTFIPESNYASVIVYKGFDSASGLNL